MEISTQTMTNAPTKAFRTAAVAALIIGVASYLIGLFNAYMQLNEKGYYLTVMLLGLFAVVSLQKTIRDKMAGLLYCLWGCYCGSHCFVNCGAV